MAQPAVRGAHAPDEFSRLHRLFLEHLGCAIAVLWLAAAAAAFQAPWIRNIRGLIDPYGSPESTLSFLFGLPALMTVAWIAVACGENVLRRSAMLRNQAIEFGIAGLVAFTIFCLAIHRVVTVVSLGQ